MSPHVAFRQVSKSYLDGRGQSVLAVDDLSLELEQGELLTLLGPSGCGKTTTLRLCAGFESPSRGRIEIDGRDVSGEPPERRNLGVVFQSYALFPHLSVRQNAAFGLTVQKKRDLSPIDALAKSLQLDGLLDRAPHELSGGQQQRVALLRALVTEPRVLLLDEPLSNLDARLRLTLGRDIRALQRRLGITTLNVTHDQEEAMSLSDRIAVMQAGKVAQLGTPRDLYEQPRSRFVASCLGEASFLPAQVTGRDGAMLLADTPLGPVRAAFPGTLGDAREVCLMLRPEALRLTAGSGGRVHTSTYIGSEMRYEVEVGGHILAVRQPAQGTEPLSAGSTVTIEVVRATLLPAS
jgi:iron(III) transport system ATP-binding protein